jgi:hypothetical protein
MEVASELKKSSFCGIVVMKDKFKQAKKKMEVL